MTCRMHAPFVLLAFVLPLVCFLVMHLFVFTNYTGNVFHEEGFVEQYSSGIYRYRVLGRELLLLLHDAIRPFVPDGPMRLPRDAKATKAFYWSYLAWNGGFALLTSTAFYRLTFLRKREPRDVDLVVYLYFLLIWTLSFSVPTPYDQMAYFFLAASLLSARKGSLGAMAWLGAAAISGALTRETQFLFTPAIVTIALFGDPSLRRRRLWMGAYHLVVFATCYLALRIHYGFERGIVHSLLPGRSLTQLVFAAMLAGLLLMTVMVAVRKVRDSRIALVFFAASLPYSLPVIASGIYGEIRLVVPLVLCLLVIYSEIERDGCAMAKLDALHEPARADVGFDAAEGEIVRHHGRRRLNE